MRKLLLLPVLFIFFAISAFAQSGRHTWAMGPLSWNDFQHKSAIDGKTSYLEYFMNIGRREVKGDKVNFSVPNIEAYTTPEYSWADTAYRSAQLLAYNQCLFDIVEMHRRIMTREISQKDMLDYDQFMAKCIHRLDEDLLRAEKETRCGSDTLALQLLQARVRVGLDTLVPFTPSRFEDGGWAWGVTIGAAAKAAIEEVSHFFSPGGGLDFNFDLSNKRHYFTWGTYIGWHRARTNIWDKPFFDELGVVPPQEGVYYYPDSSFEEPYLYMGDVATCLDMYLAYGYTVFNNNVHKITPFVGYGLEGYYFTDDENSYGPTIGSWHLGIDYNYLLTNNIDHGSLSFNPRYNATHNTTSVNCKLCATYNNFKKTVGTPQGFSINLQVNIGFSIGNTHYE